MLSQPVTTKHSDNGSIGGLSYGLSEMQGWRVTMEDAHIACALQPPRGVELNCSLFAVFDGHGGNEVSKFCENHFAEELVALDDYMNGDIESALRKAMHRMDIMLQLPRYSQELQEYGHMLDGNIHGQIASLETQLELLKADTRELQEVINSMKDELAISTVFDEAPELTQEEREKHERFTMIARALAPMQANFEVNANNREAKERNIRILTDLQENRAQEIKMLADELAFKKAAVQMQDSSAYSVPSGCTANVVVIIGEDMYVANVGDSRSIMCKNGYAHALSKDHKPFLAEEKRRIEAAGGYVTALGRVCSNLNLSRSIGDLIYKTNFHLPPEKQIITAEPDIRHVVLENSMQFVVIACDGIWDVKTNQEVVDFVVEHMRQFEQVSEIVEKLMDRCLIGTFSVRGFTIGRDNMTCIVVFLQPIEEVWSQIKRLSVVNKVYRRIKSTLKRK